VGFLAGLVATLVVASVLAAFATAVIEDTPVAEAGMFAAFFAELRTLSQDASVAAQVHSSFRSFHDLLNPLSANLG
jgi:hypothetical protein